MADIITFFKFIYCGYEDVSMPVFLAFTATVAVLLAALSFLVVLSQSLHRFTFQLIGTVNLFGSKELAVTLVIFLTDAEDLLAALKTCLNFLVGLGIEYTVAKLDTGDYMIPGGSVTVDRKASLEELAGNLCSKSHRFWREVRRSHDTGLKLIVLVENGRYHGIEDVKAWKSAYSRVSGRYLANEMARVAIAYGVEFLFCNKKSTGKRIAEILDYDH